MRISGTSLNPLNSNINLALLVASFEYVRISDQNGKRRLKEALSNWRAFPNEQHMVVSQHPLHRPNHSSHTLCNTLIHSVICLRTMTTCKLLNWCIFYSYLPMHCLPSCPSPLCVCVYSSYVTMHSLHLLSSFTSIYTRSWLRAQANS